LNVRKGFFFGKARTLLVVMLWCVGVLPALMLINLVGIRLAGSIDTWQGWLNAHTQHFFFWRCILYANLVAGWIWMRRRVLQREPTQEARWRLARVELLSLVSVVLLEISLVSIDGPLP
jgi:hypothetical protein